ncbi:MAG: hypothetical protein K9J30_10000 [Bacteroidales bacterium]|nr:hypothetical protein [Bacteroidales bacterium]
MDGSECSFARPVKLGNAESRQFFRDEQFTDERNAANGHYGQTLIILVAVDGSQESQGSFIGLTKPEVKQLLKKDYQGFKPDRRVIKQKFNYLKYINSNETITWILYFKENDICSSTKKICDYAEYDFVLDELNAKYESAGEMEWKYKHEGNVYSIKVTELDWYFVVRETMME